jgi:hypothetical protein
MTATARSAPCAAHFTLQGKGGVGKSLVAAILAQYFDDKGASPTCIDTDPVNQTLTSYKALKATHLAVRAKNSSRVDERRFDALVKEILSREGIFIVDNGASTFIPLSNYLLENDVMQILQEAKREVFIHVVITGGQALLETLEGFRALAQASALQSIIVWLNEFFGPIEYESKTFADMKVYKDNAQKVRGFVRIEQRNPDTFGHDMLELAAHKLTFSEALQDPRWDLMARQRIRTVQRDLYEQIDRLGL